MNESNLILGMSGMPPQSARNCIQELSPVTNGEFRKSLNGDLLFLQSHDRKRYKSVISCKDNNSPLIDSIWIGSSITVGCIQNIWQSIEPGKKQLTLMRPAVAGSVCAVNNFGIPIKFELNDNNVELYKEYSETIYICFRPWLLMNVIDFCLETNEWGMTGGWKLVLEEI